MWTVRDIPTIIEQAPHYIAIGQQDIHLFSSRQDEADDLDLFPWSYVVGVSQGGTYRLSVPVSLHFDAPHPCDLTFSWTCDIEGPDANGTGSLALDIDKLARILARLSPRPRSQAEAILSTIAEKLQKTGEEAMAYTQKVLAQEATLRGLLRGPIYVIGEES